MNENIVFKNGKYSLKEEEEQIEQISNSPLEDMLEEIYQETLEEMSSMASGGVEGFSNTKNNKKPNQIFEVKNRDEFIQELILRRIIRERIQYLEEKMNKKYYIQEKKIRNIIKELILSEAKEDRPHHSTGVNVLADVLKKTIPTLEIDYKKLTTNEKQRKSFENHILKALQGTLTREKVEDEAGTEEGKQDLKMGLGQNIGQQTPNITQDDTGLAEAEIDLGNDNEPDISSGVSQNQTQMNPKGLSDQDKFIDIDRPSRKKNQEKKNDPMNNFAIPGEDETGRNMALQAYQKIEKSIAEAYGSLSDPEDKRIFAEYALINFKLWFDRFNNELQADVRPPNIPEPKEEPQDNQTSNIGM